MRTPPSAFFAVVLCLSSVTVATAATAATSRDASGDGRVTVVDAVQALDAGGPADGLRTLRRAAGLPADAAHAATPRVGVPPVDVEFHFEATAELQGFHVEIAYPLAKGGFAGSADGVACHSNGDGIFLADDRDDGTMALLHASAVALTFPIDVTCRFEPAAGQTLAAADIGVTVVEVVENGSPGDPAHLLTTVSLVAPSACSTAPATGCRGLAPDHQSILLLKDHPRADDELAWRWLGGEATSATDFGRPDIDTDIGVCLYTPTESSSALTFSARAAAASLCGNGPCCHATPKGGFVYRDPTGSAQGLTRIELTPGPTGKSRITVKGRGPNLPLPQLPITAPAIVQLQASNGNCWEAAFTADDLLRNDPKRFRAITR